MSRFGDKLVDENLLVILQIFKSFFPQDSLYLLKHSQI